MTTVIHAPSRRTRSGTGDDARHRLRPRVARVVRPVASWEATLLPVHTPDLDLGRFEASCADSRPFRSVLVLDRAASPRLPFVERAVRPIACDEAAIAPLPTPDLDVDRFEVTRAGTRLRRTRRRRGPGAGPRRGPADRSARPGAPVRPRR